MSFKGKQLSLSLTLPDEACFENFYSSTKNQHVVLALKNIFTQPEWLILLSARKKQGISHLLQACCQQAHEAQYAVFYLSLENFFDYDPKILENLLQMDLLCLDDLEAIAGNQAWEEALFHLYNEFHAQANKKRLVIGLHQSLDKCAWALKDFSSRLKAGLGFTLCPLEDTEKLGILQHRAKIRGFELSKEVGEYLLKHCSRDLSALMQVFNQLDEKSFNLQRRVTIPFVREIFKKHDE